MTYDFTTQTTKQFNSSYDAEQKWRVHSPAFRSELRDKQLKRRTPKNYFTQLVVLGNHILQNA